MHGPTFNWGGLCIVPLIWGGLLIGKKLSILTDIELSLYSSPYTRCIQTAQLIANGMEKRLKIEATIKLGDPGSLFQKGDDVWTEELRLFGKEGFRKRLIAHIMGEEREGYYSTKESYVNLIGFLKPHLQKKQITICISHDQYVAIVIGEVTKHLDKDLRVPFAEGILFLRRGDKYFGVWRGEEFSIQESIKSTVPIIIR
jgi:broad specificity phosphatase PhoE